MCPGYESFRRDNLGRTLEREVAVRNTLAYSVDMISSSRDSNACEILGLIEGRVCDRRSVKYLCLLKSREILMLDEMLKSREILMLDEMLKSREILMLDEILKSREILMLGEMQKSREILMLDEMLKSREILMLGEMLPLQLITAKLGGSIVSSKDRDHQLYEACCFHNRFFAFPCVGSFTSPGIIYRRDQRLSCLFQKTRAKWGERNCPSFETIGDLTEHELQHELQRELQHVLQREL